MKLLDYIRGLRKGKEAHRLEKESMKDPFLADAMDGYHIMVRFMMVTCILIMDFGIHSVLNFL